MLHPFSLEPKSFEKIDPVKQSSSRNSGPAIQMRHAAPASSDGVQIYSDGSRTKESMGAIAIMFKDGSQRQSLSKYLGPAHSVHEAEIAGLYLAVELAWRHAPGHEMVIYTDNRAVLLALDNTKAMTAQYLGNALQDA